MHQDPSTIRHEAHPETGEVYVVVQPGSSKKMKKEEAANSGPPDMYQVRGCGVFSMFCVAVTNENFS